MTKKLKLDIASDELLLITHQFRCMSPERTLSERRLGFSISKYPKLRSVATEAFINPESLRPFMALRKRIAAFVEWETVQCPNGYVIEPDMARVNRVTKKLQEFAVQAESMRADFIAEYEANCEERVRQIRVRFADFPHLDELITAIEENRPSVEELKGHIYFTYQVSRSSGLQFDFDADEESRIVGGFVELRKGLYGQALAEVARFVGNVVHENKIDDVKDVIRQKTVKRARSVIEKIHNVAFVSPNMRRLARSVEDAFDTLPQLGPLTGAALEDFKTILKALSNQRHLLKCADDGLPVLTVSDSSGSSASAPLTAAIAAQATFVGKCIDDLFAQPTSTDDTAPAEESDDNEHTDDAALVAEETVKAQDGGNVASETPAAEAQKTSSEVAAPKQPVNLVPAKADKSVNSNAKATSSEPAKVAPKPAAAEKGNLRIGGLSF